MKRLGILVVGAALGMIAHDPAWAKGFKARPFTLVEERECQASAGWTTKDGLPDVGKANHALHLAVAGIGLECAAAGAAIDGVTGVFLNELGFDYHGECVDDRSPRLNVETAGGGHVFLTCQGADAPVPGAPEWRRARFVCPIFGLRVVSITLVVDDPGAFLVDNLDVNGVLIGKPGNHGAQSPDTPPCLGIPD